MSFGSPLLLKRDDGQVAQRGVGADRLHHFAAVEFRQVEVEQDQRQAGIAWRFACEPVERERAVVRDDERMRDARFGERQAREFDVVEVVLDQQHRREDHSVAAACGTNKRAIAPSPIALRSATCRHGVRAMRRAMARPRPQPSGCACADEALERFAEARRVRGIEAVAVIANAQRRAARIAFAHRPGCARGDRRRA